VSTHAQLSESKSSGKRDSKAKPKEVYQVADKLNGKKVLALVENGFEQIELTDPRTELEAAGASVDLCSPQRDSVRGWDHRQWGDEFRVDCHLDEVNEKDYDALLLPGGVMSPDLLRMNPKAVRLVREFYDSGKPIASICHGPWLLVEADVVRGCHVTSYPSIKTDLKNAGANWVDEEVVVERGLVTSRQPDDLPAFNRKMIEEFAEGTHGSAGRRRPAREKAGTRS
jgi:protease I